VVAGPGGGPGWRLEAGGWRPEHADEVCGDPAVGDDG
jgi:hypothetical protein